MLLLYATLKVMATKKAKPLTPLILAYYCPMCLHTDFMNEHYYQKYVIKISS